MGMWRKPTARRMGDLDINCTTQSPHTNHKQPTSCQPTPKNPPPQSPCTAQAKPLSLTNPTINRATSSGRSYGHQCPEWISSTRRSENSGRTPSMASLGGMASSSQAVCWLLVSWSSWRLKMNGRGVCNGGCEGCTFGVRFNWWLRRCWGGMTTWPTWIHTARKWKILIQRKWNNKALHLPTSPPQ